jgi:hypothetical protein
MTDSRTSSGDVGSITSFPRIPAAPRQSAVRKSPSLSKLYRKLGQVGKEKMHKPRLFSLGGLAALAAVSGLVGCGAEQASFAGDLTPIAGACDAASRALLVKRGRYLQFAPREGVLVLDGAVGADGKLAATLKTQGADRKPYALSFTATLAGREISGEFVTPRCRYSVHLNQVE